MTQDEAKHCYTATIFLEPQPQALAPTNNRYQLVSEQNCMRFLKSTTRVINSCTVKDVYWKTGQHIPNVPFRTTDIWSVVSKNGDRKAKRSVVLTAKCVTRALTPRKVTTIPKKACTTCYTKDCSPTLTESHC